MYIYIHGHVHIHKHISTMYIYMYIHTHVITCTFAQTCVHKFPHIHDCQHALGIVLTIIQYIIGQFMKELS